MQCALAAIVISTIMDLVDYDEAIFLWKVNKKDFLLWTITFANTLLLGIEIGVLVGFDILWDALSGKEHLHLFASIKGLPPSSIETIAANSLSEVKLQEAAKMRAGSYSGGMKRRLSVAIALIGDPKLVILDEPVYLCKFKYTPINHFLF
ncbi:hypothetical protein ACHQM5_000747 [Ranunculus cassubicifolius]